METKAEENQVNGENRVHDGGGGAWIARENLEGGDGTQAADVNQINPTDAVRRNGNVCGQAVSIKLIGRILYTVGFVIAAISGSMLISSLIGPQFRHQIILCFSGFIVGLVLIFVGVNL